MSYILDALKKANAEREHGRGETPGLHTQPNRTTPYSPREVTPEKRKGLLIAVATALLLCVALISALFWTQATTPSTVTATSATPIPAQASSATTTIEQSAQATAAPPIGAGDPVAALKNSTTLIAPVRVAPRPLAAQPEAAPSPTPTPQPIHKSAQPMPAEVKAALPPLIISGSTYSSNPAHRMLIVNGQVYREGESLTAELTLEQIRPKSAMLRYKDTTYALPY